MNREEQMPAGVQRVAVVSDLSGFGRCSLTVALPVLSAMGVQACPLPTMLLSAHTGYPQPHIRSLSEDIQPYINHWERLGLSFEAVYTGFLGDAGQVAALEPFLRKQSGAGALCLVDPAMADHGQLYATCTPELVEQMRRLVAAATVVTPNLTEACLLTGRDYAAFLAQPPEVQREVLAQMGAQLCRMGAGAAVITGVPLAEDRLGNWIFRRENLRAEVISSARVAKNYAGTGDVFSAVLCGALLAGIKLEAAVEKAAVFVGRALRETAARRLPSQDGVMFEPFLTELMAGENGK